MKRYLSSILILSSTKTDLFSAEAGMPQLDPTYWASQAFWLILVFGVLYLSISKLYLPKIKINLDNRDSKIKEDLDEANNLRILSEKKIKEYEVILENSKKEVVNILLDSKNELDNDIKNKKEAIEKEIEDEILKAQKEILDLKKESISSINEISQEITSNIIEKMSGDKLNESSIKATVEDIAKKNIGQYL
jgi:F-type H+-transporting ATPase subunit b